MKNQQSREICRAERKAISNIIDAGIILKSRGDRITKAQARRALSRLWIARQWTINVLNLARR